MQNVRKSNTFWTSTSQLGVPKNQRIMTEHMTEYNGTTAEGRDSHEEIWRIWRFAKQVFDLCCQPLWYRDLVFGGGGDYKIPG